MQHGRLAWLTSGRFSWPLLLAALLTETAGIRSGHGREPHRELAVESRTSTEENVSDSSERLPSLEVRVVEAAGGLHIGAGAGFLRAANGSVQHFTSCEQACRQCWDDHYQGCLAYCEVGCQDYCTKQLPRPHCETHQMWVAQVAHVFQALNAKAVMCQATGLSGCPAPPLLAIPTPIPYDPYTTAKASKVTKGGAEELHPSKDVSRKVFAGHAS